MRILKLTLKKQWFDLIASGEKKEEYRTPGPWIESRVNPQKNYDAVEFTNGYSKGRAVILVEYNGATRGCGRSKWGAVPGVEYLILFLGNVIKHTPGDPAKRVETVGAWLLRTQPDSFTACNKLIEKVKARGHRPGLVALAEYIEEMREVEADAGTDDPLENGWIGQDGRP